MVRLDLDSWCRREAFTHFSRARNPFYSVTFDVDVTRAAAWAKERGLSFYYTMTWLCSRAVHQVDALMLDIRGGEVWRLDSRKPSFTDLHPGAEQFHIVTLPMLEDPEAFCHAARTASEAQKTFLDESQEGRDLIYITCLPWVRMTGLTTTLDADPDDCVPRVSWGRWEECGGRKILGLCMEVNHRTVDGIHIGQFVRALEDAIAGLD